MLELLKEKIKQTLNVWELSHYALQNGNESLGLPGENGPIVKEKFEVLHEQPDNEPKCEESNYQQ